MDTAAYNREAWDRQVREGNRWTVPVTPEVVAAARRGAWSVLLTPSRPVPREWFGALAGARVLALASGGGQQGPILAAAGARVTVFDASEEQLAQDRRVAEREGLTLTTVQGDMRDLSAFEDGTFDLVFHPVSNCFCPEIRPVWREVFRVLAGGGALLAGFMNPMLYALDQDRLEQGELHIKYSLPYSDLHSLSDDERRRYTDKGEPLVFAHTLEDQLGGQLDAGFVLTSMFEDRGLDGIEAVVDAYFAAAIATRAVKP